MNTFDANESLIPLNDKIHRDLRIKPSVLFEHANDQHIIPLMVDEVIDAATEFPVVFVKDTALGDFTLVAMMALEGGNNLYCGRLGGLGSFSANYCGNYVPLVLRLYPFSLVHTNAQGETDNIAPSGRMEVCIHNDSNVISTTSGEALFTETGEQTLFLQQQTQLLLKHQEQQQLTQAFITLLLTNNLLQVQKVDVQISSTKKYSLKGIYSIDQTALDKMSVDTWTGLRDSGALQVVYAQIASLKQLNRLARLTANLQPADE